MRVLKSWWDVPGQPQPAGTRCRSCLPHGKSSHGETRAGGTRMPGEGAGPVPGLASPRGVVEKDFLCLDGAWHQVGGVFFLF